MRKALIWGAIFLPTCRPAADADRSAHANGTIEPNAFATHFQVQRTVDGMQLAVFGPGGRADTLGTYALQDASIGGPAHAGRTLNVPCRQIALMTTTAGYFLEVLGVADRVIASVYPEELRTNGLRERYRSGVLVELPGAPDAAREQLIALHPDVVFDAPYGHSRPLNDQPYTTVPVCEYLEHAPLGRAEWLRFFGAITGTEARADSILKTVQDRYRAMASSRTGSTGRPTVFFGSYWQGRWSVPAGDSYMARLITDAGGEYLHAGEGHGENLGLSIEQVLADAALADQWGMIVDVKDLERSAQLPGLDQRLVSAMALRHGHIFVANTAEADLFGKALLEPDVLLADLIALFDPRHHPDHIGTYFRAIRQ
ncbi:MAG: ABC transporter substrate-binding protein [Flavobacteriales bacterium]|nr:ABC transporter substrate-binding protein [Flavobacteriales bacterium]